MNINRYYNTLASNKKELERHIPPANKEWKNSVYSYNKTLLNDVALKDENTYNIMKSYLNSYFINVNSINNKTSFKSMRMRSYMRRLSTKKVFISKPDIKQTTNKVIFTLYIFDRENKLFKKNVFILNKLLKDNNFIYSKKTCLKKNSFFRKFKTTFDNNFSRFKNMSVLKKYFFKKHMKNYKVNYNLLPKLIMPSIINKQSLLKDFFVYSYLIWMLKKNFNITVNLSKYCSKCHIENNINMKSSQFCNNCGKTFNTNFAILTILKGENKLFISDRFKLKDIKTINIILSKYLNNFLHNIFHYNKLINTNKLFNYYVTLKKSFFIKKILKKEYNFINIFTISNYNNFKYTILLSKIKNYISNLYFKNVEFNLVNLKYLHLNSDIFMEALVIKLKKKLSLLRVLNKSLHLVKRPSKFSGMLEDKSSLSKKNLAFLPYNILNSNIFNKDTILKIHKFDTINNILNSLKYKWISGIKLEAKGRLTKRYTASRAIFKYITKGNLRNLEKLYNTDFDDSTPNVYLTRKQFKPNLQHTYVYSNKRIGTFGLKGWISSV